MRMMQWMDATWESYRLAADVLVNGILISLNVAGKLGSMLGGAGIAFLHYMNEKAETGYYGAFGINGSIDLNILLVGIGYSFNASMPIDRNLIEVTNGKSYSFNDWTAPETVLWVSTTAAISGMICSLLEANLSKMKSAGEDQKYYDSVKPKAKEYLYVSLSSLLNSVAITTFSCVLAKEVLDFSLSYLARQNFTIPSMGSCEVSEEYYIGPVNSQEYPIDFSESQNSSTCLPVFNIPEEVNARVDVYTEGKLLYGLGMFFKPSEDARKALAMVPLSLSIPAAFFTRVFSNKATHERDKRLLPDDRRLT